MPRTTILLALLATLAFAAPAAASSTTSVGIADDGEMLKGSDAQVNEIAQRWKAMGVDTVRIFARWAAVAPAVDARAKPQGFDARDPGDPGYHFGAIDRAVTAVRAAGMEVMLNITGSGPCWATSRPSRCDNAGKRRAGRYTSRHYPSPSAYADYAEAVSRRYAAQVDTYILYNEPNQTAWLQPQATCVRRRCTPESPHVYRRLVQAAIPRIRSADPPAKVLIGALAPYGKTLLPTTSARYYNATVRPLDFIRAMGCVDSRYRRIRTGSCRGFRPVQADGFAYHPHGIRLAPNRKSPNRGDAQMGDLSRLTSVIDKVTRRGGLRVRGARRFPLYLDEYAYQTNPPDRFVGVSLGRQASYLQQGAYIAWRNPRVMNLTQYVYRDDPGSDRGWQSGLLTSAGAPKPSLEVFPIPFWAQKTARGQVQLWGQVRPGSGVRDVVLQRRSGSTWVPIATVSTNQDGYYAATIAQSRATTYRAVTPAGATARRFVIG